MDKVDWWHYYWLTICLVQAQEKHFKTLSAFDRKVEEWPWLQVVSWLLPDKMPFEYCCHTDKSLGKSSSYVLPAFIKTERIFIARPPPLTSSQTFPASSEGLGHCVGTAVHFLPKLKAGNRTTREQKRKEKSRDSSIITTCDTAKYFRSLPP